MHIYHLSAITNIHVYGKHMHPKEQSDQGLFASFPQQIIY